MNESLSNKLLSHLQNVSQGDIWGDTEVILGRFSKQTKNTGHCKLKFNFSTKEKNLVWPFYHLNLILLQYKS